MNSVHPDDPAASRELAVLVSGRSIELSALAQRLAEAGASVFPLLDGAAAAAPGADLVICDLASEGALAQLEQVWQLSAEPKPILITLGSPRQGPTEAQGELLSGARLRYRRPLDVSSISGEILSSLKHSRLSTRVPASGAERSYPPARSSRAPRAEAPPPSLPTPAPASSPADEPAAMPSQKLGPPAIEHSVVSPELETLLAEAERRVQAQLSGHSEGQPSAPPHAGSVRLPEDMWDALRDPLDDDEGALGEALPEDGPPPSPIGAEVGTPSLLAPADSTVPPLFDTPGEDTGSHAPLPESEQTGGTHVPITAAGQALPPTLGPGRDAARADEPTHADRELPAARPPEPPSTTPPAPRARAAEPRPPPAPSVSPTSIAVAPDSLPPDAPPPGSSPSSVALALPRDADRLDLPGALVRGAPALVIGRAVRHRFTGCLAFEVDQGLRRVVFKEGDVVISVSAVHGESLVAFLAQRGDLGAEEAARIDHRLPAFGRHAGAALIARGLLEQSELWPVLRAHAEWVLAQLLQIERGSVQIEHPLPERLAAEPSVFGGATGAEVLVELVQRVVPPAQALGYIGSDGVALVRGPASELLAECALPRPLLDWVRRAEQLELSQLLDESRDEPMLPCVLYALCLLEVLRPAAPESRPGRGATGLYAAASGRDTIDDEALRAKVRARRALVDEGDYFALLGVARGATAYDIRRSYLDLRRQFDPGQVLRAATLDLKEDLDVIVEILDEAYEILRDQHRRERYRRAIESRP